jgi:hypothetical protein
MGWLWRALDVGILSLVDGADKIKRVPLALLLPGGVSLAWTKESVYRLLRFGVHPGGLFNVLVAQHKGVPAIEGPSVVFNGHILGCRKTSTHQTSHARLARGRTEWCSGGSSAAARRACRIRCRIYQALQSSRAHVVQRLTVASPDRRAPGTPRPSWLWPSGSSSLLIMQPSQYRAGYLTASCWCWPASRRTAETASTGQSQARVVAQTGRRVQ